MRARPAVQAAPQRPQAATGIVIPTQSQLTAGGPAPVTVNQIAQLAERQLAKEMEIEAALMKLALLNEELKLLKNSLLPSVMAEAGVSSITLPNGCEVVVEDILAANITEENKVKAFAWLRAHKAEAIIKNEFKVALGKGQDKIAKALAAACKKLKIPVTRKESVNWQTLQAFVREKLQAGKALPPEINVTKVPTAKVNRPKEM